MPSGCQPSGSAMRSGNAAPPAAAAAVSSSSAATMATSGLPLTSVPLDRHAVVGTACPGQRAAKRSAEGQLDDLCGGAAGDIDGVSRGGLAAHERQRDRPVRGGDERCRELADDALAEAQLGAA